MHEYLIYMFIYVYFYIYIVAYSGSSPCHNFIRRYIYSDIPFLQYSDDDNFHTVDKIKDIKYRYSLFFIPFGAYKIYLFTYKNNKFSWQEILFLDDILESKHEIKKSLHYESKEGIDILKDEITICEDIIKNSKFKASIYFTVVAVVISLFFVKVLDFVDFYIKQELNLQILISYIAILIFNFILFSIQFLSVRKYTQVSYDYKCNYSSKKEYYNYFIKKLYYSKFNQKYYVSYVKNIEFYLKRVLIMLVFLLPLLYINNFKKKGKIMKPFIAHYQSNLPIIASNDTICTESIEDSDVDPNIDIDFNILQSTLTLTTEESDNDHFINM